ncbi:hypothetical protein J2S97_004698 [Arthrobacter oryzae]|nr:hypothetical protein [Arthrobacter oryzae]
MGFVTALTIPTSVGSRHRLSVQGCRHYMDFRYWGVTGESVTMHVKVIYVGADILMAEPVARFKMRVLK